jgi:hypothetical protein
MTDRPVSHPWWNRREFLKTSAAAAAGAYAMRWGLAPAAEIPLEFDGSKFQLAAPEPNPKRGGVLRYGITMRPPHFDVHQLAAGARRTGNLGGVEGALKRHHSPASARQRVFDGEAEARLIALTLSPPPKGRAKWSLRLLEDKVLLQCSDNARPSVWRG